MDNVCEKHKSISTPCCPICLMDKIDKQKITIRDSQRIFKKIRENKQIAPFLLDTIIGVCENSLSGD